MLAAVKTAAFDATDANQLAQFSTPGEVNSVQRCP
jgi:hypothetical protein